MLQWDFEGEDQIEAIVQENGFQLELSISALGRSRDSVLRVFEVDLKKRFVLKPLLESEGPLYDCMRVAEEFAKSWQKEERNHE